MKINLPVTDQEHLVDPFNPIVSKTDAKGSITYVNRAFVDISGFSEAELVGRNHNIVRHPDMPPEAFADLWETIKTGRPWRGLVKNRCKNGDFYWVEAYVTPITEHGKITGYMSVRSAPRREEIAAATALYQAVRNKQAVVPSTLKALRRCIDVLRWAPLLAGSGVVLLLAGSLVPPGAGGAALATAGAVLAVSGGAWGWWRVNKVLGLLRQGFGELAEGRLGRNLQVRDGGLLGEVIGGLESLRIHYRAVVADVIGAGSRTSGQADQLRDEMHSLAARSVQQGEGLMQISRNMETMSAAIKDAAELAEQNLNGAESTKSVAEAGKDTMQAATRAAERTVSVVGTSRAAISEMDHSMQRIRTMTDMIHEIAEQTNLLALNAAIEAARAGEAGRGFSVVADEVRKLAERTSSATGSITEVVQQIGEITRQAVSSMDATVEEVEEVSGHIRQSSANLESLMQVAEQARRQANDLAMGMEENSQSVHEVAASLEQLNAIAEQNLHTTRAIEQSSNHLAETAGDLSKLTADFHKWNTR
ncbi:methyl-accepting chemotaxis protein [Pseudogulbenkiania ferrooxidans]|uniref:Methyl-accepting chemotaxis sensory transducer with Pas/Pac sensor n=1 Tax=Pseudogulbenkiania ferrooxidans 2002 TaxID=279714 RepID=B9Z3G3_9NEIS|nr:PAS domain-containing methyl-accepting chemotaxis protein [Pseudogulbenkiania ferrooxidans]EEG08390.1 methyl-accepting chemotaxis sensory transducer with Pas/Pac sensor [Pseudogulbenkiania ferrooxidans 2002]